ncbi:hypothetical protein MITS9508_01719 [Synechococcus sp. MIT S9508]|nr:hypothetical protein MITS9508_01719 [Synechococcus sp. MIT S9508]
MHRDQFRPQCRCPPASPRHRCGDVVKFEIEEHPQALLAQLRHHLRPSLHKQLQPHLHPTQPLHLAGKRQRLLGRHAIEGHDDPIGGVRSERRGQGKWVIRIPSCRAGVEMP